MERNLHINDQSQQNHQNQPQMDQKLSEESNRDENPLPDLKLVERNLHINDQSYQNHQNWPQMDQRFSEESNRDENPLPDLKLVERNLHINDQSYQNHQNWPQMDQRFSEESNRDENPHSEFISNQLAQEQTIRDDNNLDKMPILSLSTLIKNILKKKNLSQNTQNLLKSSLKFSKTKKVTFLKNLTCLERENLLSTIKEDYEELTNKKISKAQQKILNAPTQNVKKHQENIIKTLERASKAFELFIDQQPYEALKQIYRFNEGLKRVRDYEAAKKELEDHRKDLGLFW